MRKHLNVSRENLHELEKKIGQGKPKKKTKNKKVPEITIIGAGNGGRAFASYLAQKGLDVNLVFRTPHKIKKIWFYNKIESESTVDHLNGTFELKNVTPLINKVVPYSDIILLVVPAFAHASVIKKISFYLQEGQIILLNPGRTWGAIEAQTLIQKLRPDIRVFVGETQTLLFTCRKIKDTGVNISKIKNRVHYCFYPENDNFIVEDVIETIFPELESYPNIFYTSLNNIGAMIHPAATMLNSGSISRCSPFKFYNDGITKHIAQTIASVDRERLKIMDRLDVPSLSLLDWIEQVYGVKEDNLYDAFHAVPSYENIGSPQSLNKRYLTEDVPTGLVPMASLADYLDIKVPTMKSLIQLASLSLGKNFWKTGRSLHNIDFPIHLIEDQFESRKKIYT